MKRTLIIAEAGVNHNGDLGLALEMIKVAADAGADLVKFQTFVTASNIARNAPKAQYQIASTGDADSQFEMVRKLELSSGDHDTLVAACESAGIRFFSTGFDAESVDLLIELGADLIKIPSGEVTNLPLLRHIAAKRLPTIMSTGMATLGEIEAALAVLVAGGVRREDVTLLHCTSEYPAPFDEVNLGAMATMRAAFRLDVGYSDHTLGIEVPIAATALGATVIEKHFTLDKTLPGPDHQASATPDELRAMVSGIRNVDTALAGDGLKRPSPSEVENRLIVRKSIVAARAIKAGEPLTADNLATKRPGTGLSPMLWDAVIGRPAARDYQPDELIEP